MNSFKRLLVQITVSMVLFKAGHVAAGTTEAASTGGQGNQESGAMCPDAKIFEKMIKGVCWSCTMPARIMGVGGDVPDGASDKVS